jgi:hypothetical protein
MFRSTLSIVEYQYSQWDSEINGHTAVYPLTGGRSDYNLFSSHILATVAIKTRKIDSDYIKTIHQSKENMKR